MAKCIRIKEGEGFTKPIRVSDAQAAEIVNTGKGVYVPKHEWKKEARPNKAWTGVTGEVVAK